MIFITPKAKEAISAARTDESMANGRLKIAVKSGGCETLYYEISFSGEPTASDESEFEFGGETFVINPKALKYLKNSFIDFENDSFKIINPSANTCGCGMSFSL